MRYPRSQGFGSGGIAVTDAGYVFRFARGAVGKVRFYNSSGDDLYVGVNAEITGAGNNDVFTGDAEKVDFVETLTAAQALAKGILVQEDDYVDIKSEESFTLEKRIYSVWAITASGKTATLKGGAISL